MKTVYAIIGSGDKERALAHIRSLTFKEEVNIVLVSDINDIPIKERLSSDPSIIQKITEIKQSPIHKEHYFEKKKTKGHDKPYKYHK